MTIISDRTIFFFAKSDQKYGESDMIGTALSGTVPL